MLQVNNLIGFGAEPPGGIVTVLDQAFNIPSNTWNGYTLRQRIERAALSGVPSGATKIRVTGEAAAAEGVSWDATYVGFASGSDAWDAASLTQITWSGGSGSGSISAGAQLTSDLISFADDGTSALILTIHFNSSSDSIGEYDAFTGLGNRYFKAAASEAATGNVSGYTSTPNRLAFYTKIEMGN